MDYMLSNVVVARDFTACIGTTVGVSSAKWRITIPSFPEGFNEIDLVVVVVVLLIIVVICYRFVIDHS